MLIDVRIIYGRFDFIITLRMKVVWMEADISWGIEVIAQVKVDDGISWILFLERLLVVYMRSPSVCRQNGTDYDIVIVI